MVIFIAKFQFLLHHGLGQSAKRCPSASRRTLDEIHYEYGGSMENFSALIIVVCFIFAILSIVIGIIVVVVVYSELNMIFYAIIGSITSATLWSWLGIVLRINISNFTLLQNIFLQSTQKTKYIKIIECKNCKKEYDKSLKSCPYCGTKK
jgi:hypothetical protein